VRASDYRGERQMQLEWVDFRPVETEIIEIPKVSGPEWEDYREAEDALGVLRVLKERGVQVWAEGETNPAVEGVNRLALIPAKELAVWTQPPSPDVWQAILARVKPEKVYVFAAGAETDRAENFIKRLAGLLKFAVRTQGGQVAVERLAAETAQREETVRKGLVWLVEKGMFDVQWKSDGVVEVAAGMGQKGNSLAKVEDELHKALDETRAFRRYFREAMLI